MGSIRRDKFVEYQGGMSFGPVEVFGQGLSDSSKCNGKWSLVTTFCGRLLSQQLIFKTGPVPTRGPSHRPIPPLTIGFSMRFSLRSLLLVGLSLVVSTGRSEDPEPKFEILFNGKDLTGWSGDASLWSVQDGTIVGVSTAEAPLKNNTFLVWQGGEAGDFEFRCKVRFDSNNSGVQYRSELVDASKFIVAGYQADLHEKQTNFGMLYGEKLGKRGIIASRGQQIEIAADGTKSEIAKLAQGDDLVDSQWNDLRIIAVGNRLVHQINGITTVDVTDNFEGARRSGIIALQLHAGPPMKCEFRNVLLRHLKTDTEKKLIDSLSSSPGNTSSQAKEAKVAAKPKAASRSEKQTWLTAAPKPQWIWSKKSESNQRLLFRKSFELAAKAKTSTLYSTCDNTMILWINGERVAASSDWNEPIDMDVAKFLNIGTNVIAVEGKNEGGVAAFVLRMTTETEAGKKTTLISDDSWKLADTAGDGWQQPTFDDKAWGATALVVNTLGAGPWRIPNYNSDDAAKVADARDPKNILTPPGFVIDRIYNVPKSEGSWVCMTSDAGGGFYVSDQGDKGLFHVQVVDGVTQVESLVLKDPEDGKVLTGAQGLVWAMDSLWVHRSGGYIYRATDSNGDKVLDKVERYPSEASGGEHGNHALIATADGKAIYVAGGNHAKLATCETKRVQSWDEDHLLPRMSDARGHARGVMAPGGWVTRLDPITKQQELICIGFRNQYDIALNRNGDMFTFDADMEWDMGSPWYRPTRICQVVSGGDYGWRNGSGKWPSYYEDSLPPVVDIGPGSPTGVVCGTGAAFPTAYQDALFALDWTFGTIYAVHLKPNGAGYTGEREPFVYASPLPVTDAIVGADGHFYFTTGGRGTDSAMYRVRYVGNESTAVPTVDTESAAAKARETRRMLETMHGRVVDNAVETAWPYLASEDRFIRSAARVAIESQPVEQWAGRVFAEPNTQSRITSAVALARRGSSGHLAPLVASLLQLKPSELPESQFLGLLRAYSLAFIRLGNVDDSVKQQVIDQLNPQLPNESASLNQELIAMMVYLKAPDVVAKTMSLIDNPSTPVLPDWGDVTSRNQGYGKGIEQMLENPPPSREIGYAMSLRNVHKGWTLDQRRGLIEFLNVAAKGSGGASFPGYLSNIRDEVLANCSNEDRLALKDVTGEDFNPVPSFAIAPVVGPGSKWTLDSAQKASRGKPDFERGRSLYFAAECGKCHRLAGLGGGVGPDLTSVPNKFDERYVIEAIVEPSKVISDQYGSSNVLLSDGRILVGIVVEKGDAIEVYPIKVTEEPIRVSLDDVESIEPSKVSQMPEGLLDRLNADEVRDLVGYVMSGGNPDDRRYKK